MSDPNVTTVNEMNAFLDSYVESYEFRGDDGDYSPSEQEQMLITDATQGLIGDDDFSRLFIAQELAIRDRRAAEFCCRNCGAAFYGEHFGGCKPHPLDALNR